MLALWKNVVNRPKVIALTKCALCREKFLKKVKPSVSSLNSVI